MAGAPDTIVVALSGGVDSATACALLVEAGHRVIGLTLRLSDLPASQSAPGRCCGPRDLEDARAVAAHLDIPFYVVDHTAEFGAHVIDDFVGEYLAGRTPNPCVRCNEHVKFNPLVQRARALGATALATGHYARLVRGPGGAWRVARARDAQKDQSYFLFAMNEAVRDFVRFPLGDLTKDEVRAHARRLGLPNADKAESQEICFVPDGDAAGFVARRGGQVEGGDIVDGAGTVLGQHEGVHAFTIGQRKGMGRSLGQAPSYVVSIDALRRRVTVGDKQDLMRGDIVVDDLRWIGAPPAAPLEVEVQLRHRHKAAPATIVVEGRRARVAFVAPERAPAPGQAAVFYRGGEILGGGWIA
jgi:tRNA-specific 2-thiouridylase